MTRPCWSADPLDMLVTATAPLCNQGIHSHFYPASAFFLTNRDPPSSPGGRPGHPANGLPLRTYGPHGYHWQGFRGPLVGLGRRVE